MLMSDANKKGKHCASNYHSIKKRTRQTSPDNPGSSSPGNPGSSKFIVKYMFLSLVLPGILMVKY